MSRMRLLLILAGMMLPVVARAQVGALQTDCSLGGRQPADVYQFVATCAGRAASPDKRFAIVQRKYNEVQPPIELQDTKGKVLATLKTLSDDMPFSIAWAPNSRWFYANHHVGSFMDVLQVFQIIDGLAVERPGLVKAAVRTSVARYPCLPSDMVLPNGVAWSIDSRKIAIVTISRPDACGDYPKRKTVGWAPLWMIEDVDGRVEMSSIRVAPDDGTLIMPKGGAYAIFDHR